MRRTKPFMMMMLVALLSLMFNVVAWGSGMSHDATLGSDITTTAKKYAVIFKLNGNDSVNYRTDSVLESTCVKRPNSPIDSTRYLLGWALNGTPYDFNLPVMSDLTLIARWEMLEYEHYAVLYNTDGGSEVPTEIVRRNEQAKKPAAPSKQGAKFIHWLYGTVIYDFSTPVTVSKELKAVWQTIDTTHCTVVFDSDGGVELPIEEILRGDLVSPPIDPIKKGALFKGWQLAGAPYLFNTPVMSNITLKANWQLPRHRHHVVSFDADGGSPVPPSQEVEHEYDAVRPTSPIKEGSIFLRWLKEETPYNFNSPVMDHLILKARWRKLLPGNYTVYFDSKGGTEVKVQEVKEGAVAIQPITPKKEGYLFKTWVHEGLTYDFDLEVRSNLLLEAYWEKLTDDHYTVRFETSGGTAIESQIVKKGDRAVLPRTPIKSGFFFEEWQLDAKRYDFNQEVLGNITLSVKWFPVPANHFTVVFDTDGGTEIKTRGIRNGETTSRPADPTKVGALFSGWKHGFRSFDFNTPITENIVLKAYWEAVSTNHYVVNFDSNGGTPVKSQTIASGSRAIRPTLDPVKTNHLFDEWQQDGQTYDFNTPVNRNITLTAIYRTPNPGFYTVIYDSDGGTPIAPTEVKAGSVLLYPPTPTKQYHIFKGWMLNDVLVGAETKVHSNMTLKALWSALEDGYFTIHFDVDKGSYIAPITVKSGYKMPKPEEPTKENYHFIEWTLNGAPYDFTQKVYNNLLLKARWGEGASSIADGVEEQVMILIGDKQYAVKVSPEVTFNTIELYHILGTKVHQATFDGSTYQLNTSITPGYYLLRVNQKVMKIIY